MSKSKKSDHDLSDIKGLGPATIEKLKGIGITTVESLAYATHRKLEEVGIKDGARKLQSEALNIMGVKLFMTGAELAEQRKDVRKLSTGSKGLDALFGGGYETRSITEIVGEYGSGKSQLAFTASIMVQVPEAEGGLNGTALIIDTEETVRSERLAQIARCRGLDPEKAIERVIIAPAFNSDHQDLILSEAERIMRKNNVRLIIVDSLIAHFRSEYVGRENLSPRQQEINQHLQHISTLARAFNAVAIITNQAIATPDNFYSHIQWKPAGGNIVAHKGQLRIAVRKSKDPIRIARILDSSFLPVGEFPFQINERGIDDLAEEKPKAGP